MLCVNFLKTGGDNFKFKCKLLTSYIESILFVKKTETMLSLSWMLKKL